MRMKSHKNQKNQKELGSRPTDVAKNATTKKEMADFIYEYLENN